MLHDFGPSLGQFALRKGAQKLRIGQDERRLIKRADHILAGGMVDSGLAADRAVDQCQQAGRDLHDADSAEHDRRSKPGQIADHPTAERDHDIVALDSALEHRTNDGTGGIPALAAFATWNGDRLDRQSGRFERSAHALTMKRPDIRIGDDEGLPRLWPLRGYMATSLVHDPRAYKDPGLAAGRIQHHIRLSRF